MSNNRIVFGIIIFAFLLALPCFGADVAKIGVVDLQEIMKKSDAGKAAQTEITTYGNKLKEDFDTKQKEVEDLKNALDREAYVMDKEKLEEKERDIRIKVSDIKALQKKYTQELKEYEGKLVKKIHDEIMAVIENLGKKEGYLLVVERTVVLYNPSTIDITDTIIKLYNEEYAKKPKEKAN